MNQTKIKLDLEPVGRRIEVDRTTDLLSAAQKAGVDLVAACGGVGICGGCRVRLIAGQLSPVTPSEEEQLSAADLAQGYRLACQAYPLTDVRLDIPPESLPVAQKMQVEGRESALVLDPNVMALDVDLSAPDLQDLRADLTRANQAVEAAGLPALRGEPPLLEQLSLHLRHHAWKARLALCLHDGASELVGVLAAGTALLGLAVDMGSTKLALYLVDLATGATLARTGVMNPQIAYGEDVVSRIAFANKSDENRRLLQTRLTETINQAVRGLCAEIEASPRQIVDVVIVGNTAMHHFFCGLPVEQLGAAPYVPAVSQPLDVRAAGLGLELAPGAWVHLPANIAGYVGGDHTAALLTTQAYADGQTIVLVDIGTNTEISAIHNGQIVACSTASGPAFEGAHIRDGMRAAPGAIEKVWREGDTLRVATIDHQPPVGICGSGILMAIAEMRDAEILDMRGALRRSDPRVRTVNGKAEVLLVSAEQSGRGREVVITRRDVNEIQLAKGAIRAGIEVLLQALEIQAGQVDAWIIAGAFGTYLDLKSALRLGMFPNAPLERFHQVGNAAGVGAKQMLLSRAKRRQAAELAERVGYIELTTCVDFTAQFVTAMALGEE